MRRPVLALSLMFSSLVLLAVQPSPPHLSLTSPVLAGAKVVKSANGLIVEGETITVVTKLPFKVIAPSEGKFWMWHMPPLWTASAKNGWLTTSPVLQVTKAPDGQGEVACQIVGKDDKLSDYVIKINIGTGETPKPPEPKPPEPKPPEPMPPPLTGPLTVLIVYESAATMTAAQNAIIYGKKVRDALKLKCAVDATAADKKAYRIWDKDIDASRVGKPWTDLMARPRSTLPWVIMTVGANIVFEGPLPTTPDAMVGLLNKFGPSGRRRKLRRPYRPRPISPSLASTRQAA